MCRTELDFSAILSVFFFFFLRLVFVLFVCTLLLCISTVYILFRWPFMRGYFIMDFLVLFLGLGLCC